MLPCEGVSLDVFFPPIGRNNSDRAYREARMICASCDDDVAAKCLAIVMANEHATFRYGFAGRMSPAERGRLAQAMYATG